MKKVLAAILAAALLVSAASACGSDTADPSGGTPKAPAPLARQTRAHRSPTP